MDEIKDIELRSEKVRNIIGQIPSRLIRMGITVIFVVVLAVLTGAYFFQIDRTVDAPAQLYMKNDRIHYRIEVPRNKLKYLETGQKLVITVHNENENSFTTTIQHIDSTVHLNKEQAYYQAYGVIANRNLQANKQLEAKATIYVGKANVIDKVLGR
jgi:hypothetical protein